jgi:tRNA(Ile)-lysidine synthase
VLLHLLLQAARRARQVTVRGLHIDHGLQPAAAEFRRFCRRTARSWGVPLQILRAEVHPAPGESVEAVARDARYAALMSALRPGELLLTAQHADDQLETLLLALLRGAGPAGLASMPATAGFGSTQLLRPLLQFERQELAAYAARSGLEWQEDPTNTRLRFDRNYLRARVIPVLRDRWPAIARTASRSAAHCAAAAAAIGEAARRDLAAAADGPDLEIAVLRRMAAARRAAVLRTWIGSRGFLVPEARHLEQIVVLMDARIDAQPELRLPGFIVRRHAGRLVLEAHPSSRAAAPAMLHWSWHEGALRLPGGELQIVADRHGDLDLARLPRQLQVQYPSTPGGRSLRKIMQELAVPEWQRARLPIVFAARRPGAPLAIADLWLAARLRSSARTRRSGRIFWRELR